MMTSSSQEDEMKKENMGSKDTMEGTILLYIIWGTDDDILLLLLYQFNCIFISIYVISYIGNTFFIACFMELHVYVVS